MAESENPELTELKSIIKSFVISGEGNATIGRICREYEDMEGCGIPYHKFGFHNMTEFFKSAVFRDEFFFGCNKDGVEVLRPKTDEKTAHIQDLVRNQKHKNPNKKRKPFNRFTVSRAGTRAVAGTGAFNFHAAGMSRPGFNAFARKTAATPSQFYTNTATRFQNRSTGFTIRNQNQPHQQGQQQQQPPAAQVPVRPLTAQQTNRLPQAQIQQQTPNWASPVKPSGNQLRRPNLADGQNVQKTSTPSVVPNKAISFSYGQEVKPASSSASGRTVVTNFANKGPEATKSLVKVVTTPATSFKAPVIRPVGRGAGASKPKSDLPPGVPVLTADQLDHQHWLRMKCLQTLYYVRREASLTGYSINDFAAKFFQINKTFLSKECEALGSSDPIQFLQQSFASPPASPTSSDSEKTVDMASADSSDKSDKAGSGSVNNNNGNNNKLLKIVANSSLMFNRKRFKGLVQRLVDIVLTPLLKVGKGAVKSAASSIPEEFLPPVLEDKLRQALGPKYEGRAELAALLVRWFFNRFLPSSQSGASVLVPRDIHSFCQELQIFSREMEKLTFPYSLFPIPSDINQFIREMDDSELSDPESIRSGDAATMKWIPINICSVLTPAKMYVTRVKEQEAMNLLEEEMAAFYESSEGKGLEYVIPMELLCEGQLVAVPLKSRLTSTTRRVFKAGDPDGETMERRWTRAIITHPYNTEDRTFIAHLIDMGCATKFKEARFLVRDRFLNPDLGFDMGFAVQVGLLGLIPPIGLYMKKIFEKPDTIANIPVQDVPNHLSQMGFPIPSVEFIRLNYSSKKYLTACFFKSYRRGLKYEVLIADVSKEETDDFLTESLSAKGLAEQLVVDDALSLLQGEMGMEEIMKKRIMVELKRGV